MTPIPTVAMFSTQPYDKQSFANNALYPQLAFTYFDMALNKTTAALCEGFDTVNVFVNDQLDAYVLGQLSLQGVKHVALRCAGYNHVDLDYAKQQGIAVSHVPAYSPEAVAEHALALIMTLNRKTHKAYNRVRDGNFDLNGLLGFTLHNKTVGIVGTGNIGAALVRLLSGFGCNIVCYDPSPDDSLGALGATYTSLETLFTCSDIISLHCPLTDASYHLIDENALASMRDGVMLINTSRGGLIDTQAVIAALKKQKLGYLGLDVYEMESELFFKDHSSDIIQDDTFERLSTFHNVLITGHQGFFTSEALSEIAQVTMENMLGFNAQFCATQGANLLSKARFLALP